MGCRGPRADTVATVKARTVAICVCIALIGAIAAGLVANALMGDDATSKTATSGLDLSEQPHPDQALKTTLLTVDGKKTTLKAQLSEKPMLINLWAQSCAPCVKELPLLEQASKTNAGIDFLGVDAQDQQLDKAKAMAAKAGMTYPWVRDPRGDFFYAVRAAALPTTLAVNPKGQILASHTGAFKSQAQLQGWIEDYLGSGTGGATPP